MSAKLLSRGRIGQDERTRSPCNNCRAAHVSYPDSNSVRSLVCLEQTEEGGET